MARACVRREGEVHLADHRHVEVLVGELVQPEHPLPQLQEAVEGGQAAPHVGDELGVDGGRDGRLEERRLERGAELVDLGVEEVGLEVGVEGGAEGPLVGLERAEELLEGEVAVGLDRRGAVEREGGRVEPHLAGGELDGRVGQVGVLERAVGPCAGAGQVAGQGRDLLLGRREGVRLAAQRLLQEDAVGRQLRLLLQEAAQLGLVEREELGPDPGGGGPEVHRQPLRPLLELARPVLPGVLVGAGLGVDVEPLQVELDRGRRVERRRGARPPSRRGGPCGRRAWAGAPSASPAPPPRRPRRGRAPSGSRCSPRGPRSARGRRSGAGARTAAERPAAMMAQAVRWLRCMRCSSAVAPGCGAGCCPARSVRPLGGRRRRQSPSSTSAPRGP